MQLDIIPPHPRLAGIIQKMWVFRSQGRAPVEDMKLIVPNGMVKLVIPFANGIIGTNNGVATHSRESCITLIGMADTPAIVDLQEDAPHGNIGIEFSPSGAYRLFAVRQAELLNRIIHLEDLLGKTARELQERVSNSTGIPEKIKLVQQYVIGLLERTDEDRVLNYCVTRIAASRGKLSVGELEHRTGYSSRWLHQKFMDRVGVSPKNLASIVRFMQFYEQWARNPDRSFYHQNMYDYFFDQAHFIREFRRFTGSTPLKFARSANEFGRTFYRG